MTVGNMARPKTGPDFMAWVERNVEDGCGKFGYSLSTDGAHALRSIWQPACDAFAESRLVDEEFQRFEAEFRFKIGLIGESFALAAKLNRSMSVNTEEVHAGMQFFWSTRATTPKCPPPQDLVSTPPPT